ncbi:MAG: low molecular weight phosphotyrosine protein phosphatase [Melioribacteraceae bacterium]|nr:low molecular weight phosphotyrosine protein phosphatase [Melioribacteraceae bacterium]
MVNVIFVCMGNICRSPSAEAVMTKLISDKGLSDKIKCDSAGTIATHTGENADSRMMRHASKRGYDLTSIARQFKMDDFDKFDYIVVMDKYNYRDISAQSRNEKDQAKILLMTDYSGDNSLNEVPDPYYGGAAGFENVLDILEKSCNGLLAEVIKKHGLNGYS